MVTGCFVQRLLLFEEDALDMLVRGEGVGAAISQCRERHVLTRQHLRDGLQRFRSDRLNANTLHVWAECFEMAEWIDYECGSEDVIADVLFELSTPEIHEVFTSDVARRMLNRLEGMD